MKYTFCDLIGDVNDLACAIGFLVDDNSTEAIYRTQDQATDLVFKLLDLLKQKGGEITDEI